METILNNFLDPSWWVTGFFPALVIWLSPRLWGTLVTALGLARVKRLRTIKELRRDELRISYEMQKAAAFYVVFVLMGVFWLIALVAVPTQKTSAFFVFLSASPVFLAEFAWLKKDAFVGDILKARNRLRCGKRGLGHA